MNISMVNVPSETFMEVYIPGDKLCQDVQYYLLLKIDY